MQKLNTTAVYILSVIGILCCCAYGIGTITAIIAIVIANKEQKKYNANPEEYSNGSAIKGARIFAIVSLIISFIGLTIFIWINLNPCTFFDWYIEMFKDNPSITAEQMQQIYDAAEKAGCR
ncbi:CCC motif membrane protein [uncultured Winogradskyella sp.]|uniref:CCC motif membrane protein n=1 Tax=uncultured Winogradskyella sp. TaxID=395353 RepID=UPI0026098D47|nr:CCC motif membrane protein [uncultured Winogradskyella sp.]